jgi:hypothetical protein
LKWVPHFGLNLKAGVLVLQGTASFYSWAAQQCSFWKCRRYGTSSSSSLLELPSEVSLRRFVSLSYLSSVDITFEIRCKQRHILRDRRPITTACPVSWGDGDKGIEIVKKNRFCTGPTRAATEMENINRGPIFGDFVTIRPSLRIAQH